MRADLDCAEDSNASLRARLEDLLGQTEDAAARSERQLHEVRMPSRLWAGVLTIQFRCVPGFLPVRQIRPLHQVVPATCSRWSMPAERARCCTLEGCDRLQGWV